MSSITLSTILVRNPDLVATDMDGDLVMMSIEKGQYYALSGIAPRIWALLETSTPFATLVQTICQEYDVAEETCRTDMHAFISDMLDKQLIIATPAP